MVFWRLCFQYLYAHKTLTAVIRVICMRYIGCFVEHDFYEPEENLIDTKSDGSDGTSSSSDVHNVPFVFFFLVSMFILEYPNDISISRLFFKGITQNKNLTQILTRSKWNTFSRLFLCISVCSAENSSFFSERFEFCMFAQLKAQANALIILLCLYYIAFKIQIGSSAIKHIKWFHVTKTPKQKKNNHIHFHEHLQSFAVDWHVFELFFWWQLNLWCSIAAKKIT